jgi:hypothetical protein
MTRTDRAPAVATPTAPTPTPAPAAPPTGTAPGTAPGGRRLTLASVDDYLGPGDRRFFGSGYRRVRHELVDLVVAAGPGATPRVSATATVEYPRDWSTKAGVDMRPHLSSVDILVLGVQLGEALLTHVRGLDEAERRSSWLRSVKLRAGLEPQEDLVGLPASATVRQVQPVAEDPRRAVSVVDTQVGAMKARCEIEHPAGRGPDAGGDPSGEATYPTIEDVLGPAAARHFGDGFKAKRPLVHDVDVDLEASEARASVAVEAAGPEAIGAVSAGLEGDHQPGLSMVDCFVTDLQLAQVLMYELDGISRADSNTLWMLRTVMTAASPDRPWTAPVPATTTVAGKQLLPVGDRTYRTVDIVGGCGGVELRASLAHALPPHTTPHPGRTSP